MVLLVSCSEKQKASDIPVILGQSKGAFPVKSEQTERLTKAFGQADSIRDVLSVTGALRLELTDESVIGMPGRVLAIGDYYFIHDIIQETAFQFEKSGAFVRQVGHRGQGPGEWGGIAQIAAYGSNIAVFNTGKFEVIVYDLDGNHLKTLATYKEAGVSPSQHFFFKEDQMFISAVRSGNPLPYSHIVLKETDRGFKKAFGFGRKNPNVDRLRLNHVHAYLGLVNNRIWSASPYSAEIKVYELDGHLLGTLKGAVQGIQEQDLDGMAEDREFALLMKEKHTNYKVVSNGVVVLNILTSIRISRNDSVSPVSIFDVDGNHLTTCRDGGGIVYGMIAGNDGDTFLAPIGLSNFPEEVLRRFLPEQAVEVLRQDGYDPQLYEKDESTWLIRLNLRDFSSTK